MAVFIFLVFPSFDYKFIYEVTKKVYGPQKQRSKINQYLTINYVCVIESVTTNNMC